MFPEPVVVMGRPTGPIPSRFSGEGGWPGHPVPSIGAKTVPGRFS
jgi:hypothetical protein